MPALALISATADGDADGAGTDSTTLVAEVTTAALANGVEYLAIYTGSAGQDGGNSYAVECVFEFGGVEHGFASSNIGSFDPPDGAVGAGCWGATIVEGDGASVCRLTCRRSTGTGGDTYLFGGGSVMCVPLSSSTLGVDYWVGGGGTVGPTSTLGANSRTSVLTPAASAAWAQLGTAVRVTPNTTGPHLVVLSAEGAHTSSASGDEVRYRFRQTTDVGGSPSTASLGVGVNAGQLEIRRRGPGSGAETEHTTIRYHEVVTLTAGVVYDFFIEVEGVNGDVEYRRPRYVVLDTAHYGEVAVLTEATGEQPAATTPRIVGPLTIADPGTAFDYVVLGSQTFANQNSWHRARLDLNGTEVPAVGGTGSAGNNNGGGATSDLHLLPVGWPAAIPSTSTPDYAISMLGVADNTDSPFGEAAGGVDGDPGTLSSVIAWRMQTVRVAGVLAANVLVPTLASDGTAGSTADATGVLDAATLVPAMAAVGVVSVLGVLDASTIVPAMAAIGSAIRNGNLDASTLVLELAAVGVGSVPGVLDASTLVLELAAAGVGSVPGVLDAETLLLELAAVGVGSVPGVLDAATLVLDMAAAGSATAAPAGISGTLDADALVLELAAAGVVSVLGAIDALTLVPVLDASGSAVSATAVAGALVADLLVLDMAAAGASARTAQLAADLLVLALDASGVRGGSGVLSSSLPLPVLSATGAAVSTLLGAMAGELLAPTLDASGSSSGTTDGAFTGSIPLLLFAASQRRPRRTVTIAPSGVVHSVLSSTLAHVVVPGER